MFKKEKFRFTFKTGVKKWQDSVTFIFLLFIVNSSNFFYVILNFTKSKSDGALVLGHWTD